MPAPWLTAAKHLLQPQFNHGWTRIKPPQIGAQDAKLDVPL
jgi:hypothetical protein